MSEQSGGKLYAAKKITVKEILGGKIEREDVQVAVLNEDGTPVKGTDDKPVFRTVKVAVKRDVCLIYGTAREHRTGATTYGNFIEFIGNFEAKNLMTADTYQSTRVIFPPIADEMATSAYMTAKQRNPDNFVEFAFIIGIAPDTRGAEGFKFTCQPLKVGEKNDDPLAILRSSLAVNFAQALGLETMAKLGLPSPGEAALQLGHDPATGEVIDGESMEVKGKGKAKTPEPAE